MSSKTKAPTLAQVRRLSRAATPGPWEERDAIQDSGHIKSIIYAEPTEGRKDGIVADTGAFPDTQAKPDARFIIAAVNYVRSLLGDD